MRKQKKKEMPKSSTKEFERALKHSRNQKYTLRLYVAGMSPRSIRAIENIRKICNENFPGRYDLVIIDIFQQPTLAMGDQIVAAPTLIKKLPLPLRRFIGEIADTDRILVGLDIKSKAKDQQAEEPDENL